MNMWPWALLEWLVALVGWNATIATGNAICTPFLFFIFNSSNLVLYRLICCVMKGDETLFALSCRNSGAQIVGAQTGVLATQSTSKQVKKGAVWAAVWAAVPAGVHGCVCIHRRLPHA